MGAQSGRSRVKCADGSTIDAFTRFSSRDNFADPMPRFDFDIAPPLSQFDDYRNRLQKGEKVTLEVNGATQGVFLIETVDTAVDEKGCWFHVDAVSPMITPYQGSVDPDIVTIASPTDVDVGTMVLTAFAPYGFTSVLTDSRSTVNALTGVQVGGRKPPTDIKKLKHEAAQANEGESAYQFAARLVTRLGTCIRLTVDGVILICAPDYTQDPVSRLMQGSGDESADCFIGAVKEHDTNDGQFSEVKVRGSRRTTPDTTESARPQQVLPMQAREALGAIPSIYRSTVAPYKPKTVKDKYSGDAEKCLSYAKLIFGMHAKDAYYITGEVDGFVSKTGAVWTVDTVVNVRIDKLGINARMWILERVLTLDERGTRTTLKLIPLGALLLGDVAS